MLGPRLIVGLSMMETLIEIMASMMAVSQMDSSHLRVMRFARLARALRGVRVIKLLRYIGALRTIIFSIISTMSSLLWTLVLLAILWYCFGVVITQIVTDDCRYPKEDGTISCDPLLVRFWSSIGESILTLFMAITGGLSWGEALDPLFAVSYLAVASMILYVVFAVFAVLNVVTGVFCNTAIESARADKDIAIMKQMHKHEQQVQLLREIFKEIDQDESNLISIKELKNAMEGKKMASFMHSMDISTQDIWTLFMVIDADGSGEISLEEFVLGCMQLQGPAKGLQIARMSYENTIMREELKSLRLDFRKLRSYVDAMARRRSGQPHPHAHHQHQPQPAIPEASPDRAFRGFTVVVNAALAGSMKRMLRRLGLLGKGGRTKSHIQGLNAVFLTENVGLEPVVQAFASFRTACEDRLPPKDVWAQTSFVTLG
eukprot:s574_g14.t1